MAYTAAWSEAIPLGSLSAADIDQAIRDTKRDIRERVAGMFGLADWSANPLVPLFVTLGAGNASLSGLIRSPNNQVIVTARNVANTADLIVAETALNVIKFGNGAMTVDTDDAFHGVKFTGLRNYFINNSGLYWRNFANSADMWGIGVDISNYILVAQDVNSAGILIGRNSNKLGFFGGVAGVGVGVQTVTGSKGGNAALASLMTALGAAGYNLVNDTTT